MSEPTITGFFSQRRRGQFDAWMRQQQAELEQWPTEIDANDTDDAGTTGITDATRGELETESGECDG